MQTKSMPKVSEGQSKDLVLDSYVMNIQVQECQGCHSCEKYSTLHEVWTHPIKTRTSALRILRPVTSVIKPLPIDRVNLARKFIPICSACVHNHSVPARPTADPREWARTLQRKAAEAYKPPTPPKAPGTPVKSTKINTNLDML
jgi:hypothetical protein